MATYDSFDFNHLYLHANKSWNNIDHIGYKFKYMCITLYDIHSCIQRDVTEICFTTVQYNNSNNVAYKTEHLGQFRHNFDNDMAKWNTSYNVNDPSIYPPFI